MLGDVFVAKYMPGTPSQPWVLQPPYLPVDDGATLVRSAAITAEHLHCMPAVTPADGCAAGLASPAGLRDRRVLASSSRRHHAAQTDSKVSGAADMRRFVARIAQACNQALDRTGAGTHCGAWSRLTGADMSDAVSRAAVACVRGNIALLPALRRQCIGRLLTPGAARRVRAMIDRAAVRELLWGRELLDVSAAASCLAVLQRNMQVLAQARGLWCESARWPVLWTRRRRSCRRC